MGTKVTKPGTRDEQWSVYRSVSVLVGHINHCRVCKSAVRVMQGAPLCDVGSCIAAKVAISFDTVLDIHRMAQPDKEGLIQACPDVKAHGEAYALTADWYNVRGTQDRLF